MSEGDSAPLFTQEVLDSFSDLDYAIYSAVLRVGSLLAFMQVRDLAEEAHVSPASVVRFCKKGGYEGFPDFKRRYCEGLRSGEVSAQVDELEVLERFIARARSDEFASAMAAAFEHMRWAKLVLFVGIGSSGHLADMGARLFSNAGCFSLALSDPFMPLVNVPDDGIVVVALSFSGRTQETLSMVSDLMSTGCKLVSVTNTGESPLAKMSDVVIAYEVPDIPVSDHLSLGTQIPTLYVLERLARMLYDDSGGRAHDTYR